MATVTTFGQMFVKWKLFFCNGSNYFAIKDSHESFHLFETTLKPVLTDIPKKYRVLVLQIKQM